MPPLQMTTGEAWTAAVNAAPATGEAWTAAVKAEAAKVVAASLDVQACETGSHKALEAAKRACSLIRGCGAVDLQCLEALIATVVTSIQDIGLKLPRPLRVSGRPQRNGPFVILIDGRFRAACALSALRLSHEHTIIMLHDYWHAPNGASGKIAPHHRLKPSRAHYNTTLGKWFDHVLRQGTLAVLRPRPGAVAAAKAGAWDFERLLEESERDPA